VDAFDPYPNSAEPNVHAATSQPANQGSSTHFSYCNTTTTEPAGAIFSQSTRHDYCLKGYE
jgi:hypothetical protein